MITLPGDVITLLNSGRFKIRYMLRAHLDDGVQGIWNGAYPLVISEVTYAPLAGNMVIPPIDSTTEMDAEVLEVRLSGLSPAVRDVLDGLGWHQRPAVLLLAFCNDAGSVTHAIPRFSGFMDSITITDAVDDTSEISLMIESNNRGLYRSSTRLASDADQRAVSANDGFFKYRAAANTDVQMYWGRKGEQYPVRPK